MEFGLADSLYWYSEFEIEDVVRHLAEMGWRNIDVGPDRIIEAMAKGREKRLRDFSELCESLGVRLWQLHLSFWDGEKDVERQDVESVERWMEICRVLNVPYVGFHPSKKEYASLEEKKKIMQHNIEFFQRVGELAEDLDVKIVVENMPDAQKTGAQITELLEIIDTAGSPCIGICLDTSHANAMNIDVIEAIHQCGRLLWATHLSCSDGAQGQHRIPYNTPLYIYSRHKIDWFKVVQALKAINYQGPFMLETWSGEYVPPIFVRDLKLEYARRLLTWLLSQ